VKLGKLAPKENAKTLSMAKFLLPDAPPPPPAKTFWEYRVTAWPMFENDNVGDCVFACMGHMLENWSAHSGTEVALTDDLIISAYSAVTGYIPGNEATDNGCAITDALAWWQSTGLAGHKIDGWAALNYDNPLQLRQAIYIFGGLDVGLQLPNSAISQFNADQTWDVVPDDGGLAGGHSVPVLGYGRDGLACITWGKIQRMTNAFLTRYLDEAYGVVSLDWLAQNGEAANSLELPALRAALAALKAN
jgi:hypothetical protein